MHQVGFKTANRVNGFPLPPSLPAPPPRRLEGRTVGAGLTATDRTDPGEEEPGVRQGGGEEYDRLTYKGSMYAEIVVKCKASCALEARVVQLTP